MPKFRHLPGYFCRNWYAFCNITGKYLYVAKAGNPGTQRTKLPDEKRCPYPELKKYNIFVTFRRLLTKYIYFFLSSDEFGTLFAI